MHLFGACFSKKSIYNMDCTNWFYENLGICFQFEEQGKDLQCRYHLKT